LEFPNLSFLVSEVAAQTWYDWHEDFVVKGNNDDTKEKGGELTFLSANRKDELLTIKFHNLGIFKIVSEKTDANADAIKRVKADLYCERMEFNYSAIKSDV
jgi:hypothetical protein